MFLLYHIIFGEEDWKEHKKVNYLYVESLMLSEGRNLQSDVAEIGQLSDSELEISVHFMALVIF